MKQFYNISLFGLLFSFVCLNASAQILDANDFGFEGTSVADWTQVAGFTEEASIKSSGSKCMKASLNYPMSSPKLQTYRNSNSSNGYFDLVAGDYTFSVMVYLVGDVPSGLKISPTSAPLFPNFSLQNVEKGKWVKLESTFTVTDAEAKTKAWVVINFTGMPNSGSGTVYIDDVYLEKEEEVVVPIITKIETIGDNNLTLEAKTYEVSLNIWLDNAATITQFYTNIEAPYQSILWDVSGVAKNQWVELKQEITVNETLVNSKFIVQVSANPELGGGTGTFYIDDIEIIDNSLSVDEYGLDSEYSIFPNPTAHNFSVKVPVKSKVYMYNALGKLVKNTQVSTSMSIIDISDLASGIYLVNIINEKNKVVKKLIIE